MQNHTPSDDHFSVSQAANVLGVSTKTIYRRIRSGQLVSEKDASGRRQIEKESVCRSVISERHGHGQSARDLLAIKHDLVNLQEIIRRVVELYEPATIEKLQQKHALLRQLKIRS